MSEMTRKEAIKILKREHEILTDAGNITKVSEALRLAISSLETDEAYQLEYEQPEFCANCIDRKALLAELDKRMKNFKGFVGSCNGIISDIYQFVQGMPSVLPKATKNDLPHCQHSDEEISKSFIEDVEAVKDQLPCGEQMDFPNTFDEFANEYGFKDKDEVYTNGSQLIQVFRVKQWLEHISTTKNDLGVDAISRADAIRLICEYRDDATETGSERDLERAYGANAVGELISDLPSVTPIRPKGHWISHGKHCEKLGVIPSGLGAYEWCSNCDCGIDVREWHRNYYNYCPNCGADMREVEDANID